MKNKISRYLSLILVLSCVLCISALAYSQTLTVNYNNDGTRVNFANTVKSNAQAGYLKSLYVGLYVFEDNIGTVVCNQSNSKVDPTSSDLTSSYSIKTLPTGNYANQGVGIVKYYSPFDTDDETINQSKVFRHTNSKSVDISTTSDPSVARAFEMANSFDIDTLGYTLIVNTDLLNHVNTLEDYCMIMQTLGLTFGDTVPVFYLDANGSTLIALKQDSSGINYMFTFVNNENMWISGRSVDTVQSETVYTKEFVDEAMRLELEAENNT